MNAQDTAQTMWAWKQVKAAEKAAKAARVAWMADVTNMAKAMAVEAADARMEAARSASNVTVKQVVMQNDAARVW